MRKSAMIGAAMAMVMAAGGAHHMTQAAQRAATMPPQQSMPVPMRKQKRKNNFDNPPDPMKKISGFTGAQLRKMRQKNGVGGKPKGEIDAQGWQMNKMHDAWFNKKFGDVAV